MPDRQWSPLTFAEPGYTSAMVGFFLSPDAAAALAVDGGMPAESLHITLCILDVDGEQLSDLQVARLLTVVDDLAAWTAPLDGVISGMGRFYAGEGSDGQDAVFAIPSVPDLDELRADLCRRLEDRDLECKDDHGWIPHITLVYVAPGAESPVAAVPTIPLRLDALTVAIGDRQTVIPLRGWSEGPMAYADAAVLSEGGALYQPVKLIDAPEWLPLLPEPGEYAHPTYGTISLTPERIARLVASVNSGTYQKDIPIDAEHELDVSGALGWFNQARVNADGSADARVEWNDRGRELLAGDRFRYVSPTFWTWWTDPVSGTEFQDVVSGAAVCVRPFFKSLSIDRALVASERGAAVPCLSLVRSEGEPVRFVASERAAPPPEVFPMPVTEQQFTDLNQKFSDLEQKFSAVVTERDQLKTEAAGLATRVSTMEAETRRKAFTDEVMGRSDANGTRWFGDVEKHVAILEALPDATRQAYIDQQRETAVRMSQVVASEIGSDARPTGPVGNAEAQILKAAEAIRAENRTLTANQAYSEALNRNPDLYRKYREEMTGK